MTLTITVSDAQAADIVAMGYAVRDYCELIIGNEAANCARIAKEKQATELAAKLAKAETVEPDAYAKITAIKLDVVVEEEGEVIK